MCASASSRAYSSSSAAALRKASRDVANYDNKQWDPESCGGPSDSAADCGKGGIKHWSKQEGSVHVEPGAQVYEDPNPEGSPIGPYPLPGAYADRQSPRAGIASAVDVRPG